MIQVETNLKVADNSGARIARVIRIYGGSHRKTCSVGDIVLKLKRAIKLKLLSLELVIQ